MTHVEDFCRQLSAREPSDQDAARAYTDARLGQRFTLQSLPWFMDGSRRARKYRQAVKNSRRPGLSPRRRKYWEKQIHRWAFRYYVYERLGIGVGNPQAVKRVRIAE